MKLHSILLFVFAFLDDSSFAEKQQHSMLRRQTDAVEIKESTSNTQNNVSFPERRLKSSKQGSKSSKGTKSNKSSKSTKSNKTSKSSNDQDVSTTSSVVPSVSPSFSFAPTKSVFTSLEDAISSIVENNDFSSYDQEDFDVAKTWFLNRSNHPYDFGMNGDEYMKERFIFALIYSANCKDGSCTWPWLVSAKDHCQWNGVTCNDSKEVTEIRMKNRNLNRKFTLFGMKSLERIDISANNLSGTFTVAGASPNLTYLDSNFNKLTGFVGGGILTNLETLWLAGNEFAGNFIADEGNLPTSLKELFLRYNKLTGFVGGGFLTNLEDLNLEFNEFAGDFIANEGNLPISVKYISLRFNKLTGFVGGGKLTNLEDLLLYYNEFAGDFIVNEENLPISIKSLRLGGNKLTGFVGGGILTNLEDLRFYKNAFTVVVEQELCNRSEVNISPSGVFICEV